MKRLVSIMLVMAMLCSVGGGFAQSGQDRIDTAESMKEYFLLVLEAFVTRYEAYPLSTAITDEYAELMYLYYKAYNSVKEIVKAETTFVTGKSTKSLISRMTPGLEEMQYTQEVDILEMHHKWKIGEITRNEFVEYISIYIRSVIKANRRTNE